MTSTPQRLSRSNSNHSTYEVDAPSYTANKRLFSNRESKQLDKNSKTTPHCDKRQRFDNIPPDSCHKSTRRSSYNENSSIHCCTPQPRSSKFLEGSMNDRVSQRPPKTYLDIDEHSVKEDQSHGRSTIKESPTAARSESRNSIFRLKKSIAATFNLTNWKFWPKENDTKKTVEESQRRVMNERQEKAERVYNEYKKAGIFRDSNTKVVSKERCDKKVTVTPLSVKHDSGIEFFEKHQAPIHLSKTTSRRISRITDADHTKRQGMIFIDPPKFVRYNSDNSDNKNESYSTSASCSKSSLPDQVNLPTKTLSLVNLRRTFSSHSVAHTSATVDESAHKIPLRRDIQKQQKLVKRISNLEVKLEEAKRQLAIATNRFKDQSSCQESVYQERTSLASKDSWHYDKSWTVSPGQDYQAEIEDQIKREGHRVVSSPSINSDNGKQIPKTHESWSSNKSFPCNPMVIVNCLHDKIDVNNALVTATSYFSDSEDEKHKKHFRDKDLFQKFNYISRKSKDEIDHTKKRSNHPVSLTSQACQKSSPSQAVGRISLTTKSSSSNIVNDRKKSTHVNPSLIVSQGISPTDIPILKTSKSTPSTRSLSESSERASTTNSANPPTKTRSRSSFTSDYFISSSPPIPIQGSSDRVNCYDNPLLPISTRGKLISTKDSDEEFQNDYGVTKYQENINDNKRSLEAEAIIPRNWKMTNLEDHLENMESFQDLTTHSRRFSVRKSNRYKCGTDEITPISTTITEENISDDVYEWPDDVF